jgi:recombination protein RecT
MTLQEKLAIQASQSKPNETTNEVATQTKAPAQSLDSVFKNTLKTMEKEIARALPRHMTVDKMCRVVTTLIRTNPALLPFLQKSPTTFWGGILLSAQLGLDLTPSLGQAYLIPYGSHIQFIIGYRGMLDLIYRSGEVSSVQCDVVYENDSLEFELGINDVFIHKPKLDGNRGKAKLYYAVFKFKSGGYHFEWMTIDQIELIRDRSASKNSGPWKTDYDEMAKKTVIRRAAKKLPMSTDFRRLIENDEVIKKEILDDMTEPQFNESEPIDTTAE